MDDRLPENRELLDAFRRANPAALERVYRAYVQEVASFLRNGFSFNSQENVFRFTGYHAPDDLQDALQETFLLGLSENARTGYNGLTPYKNYLLGIAKNVVLGKFRKDLHRVSLFVPVKREEKGCVDDNYDTQQDRLADFPTSFPAPDAVIEQNEIRQLVEGLIQELTPLQGQIVQLYFLDEESQEKIAADLGINRNHLRKHLATIKQKLLKRVKKAGLDQGRCETAMTAEVKS